MQKDLSTNGTSGGSITSASANIINNRVEALMALSNSITVELEALRIRENNIHESKIDLAAEVDRFQADIIRTALVRTGGRQRAAARLLSVKATTLHAKIRRLGLDASVAGTFED